jgi:hypothetical protein
VSSSKISYPISIFGDSDWSISSDQRIKKRILKRKYKKKENYLENLKNK